MKYARRLVVVATLALAGLSSTQVQAQPEKTKAAPATALTAADIDALVEIAGPSTLPSGLDEKSPELEKLVALFAAGKTKQALALTEKYAKANGEHFAKTDASAIASYILRRAVLVPNAELALAVDKLRFAKQGKLALQKYEQSFAGKADTAMAPSFTLNAYAQGADAVTVNAKKKTKVASIKSKLDLAMKDLEAQDKMGNFEIQNLSTDTQKKSGGKMLSNVSKTRSEISMTFARNSRA